MKSTFAARSAARSAGRSTARSAGRSAARSARYLCLTARFLCLAPRECFRHADAMNAQLSLFFMHYYKTSLGIITQSKTEYKRNRQTRTDTLKVQLAGWSPYLGLGIQDISVI